MASFCTALAMNSGPLSERIRANTEGVASGIGFRGAGLKISGLPDGWSTSSVPSPFATVSTGDPFGPEGAQIAFPASMLGRCIDLYTVTLTATTAATEVRLQVVGVTSAWSPDVICPLFVPECRACDFDFCVGGGSLLINSASECHVAVEAVSWAGIKSLFR